MDPLHQFDIQTLIPLYLWDINFSFSMSALSMVLAVIIVHGMIIFGLRHASMIPNRTQSMVEILYTFIAKLVRTNAGPEARPFIPFVFSIFTFILMGNLLGMIPGLFTFTSHIIVTCTLGLIVILFVTILGFVKHGLHFLRVFYPTGTPVLLAPLMIPIEFVSYCIRPLSLGVRLFVNMMAGHTMLKIFASFSATMFGADLIWNVAALVPTLFNVLLIAFEVFVAVLQAYVFTVLSCLYIRDAIHLH